MTRAISLIGAAKGYRQPSPPFKRFIENLRGKPPTLSMSLHPTSLDIHSGEIVGIVGVNGAGKSTLLKLIAGTSQPSSGEVIVKGSVCALLELGAGFHPDMTGRENIFLGGAVASLPYQEIKNRFDDIVQFAGLEKVIDHPIKTYSSGMMMRLAFTLSTSVDADILILDETLSVGDGHFAKKSFDRIMGFKEAGKTLLFCSHSMYQIQAICSRVIWLHEGKVQRDASPDEVIGAYTDFLSSMRSRDIEASSNDASLDEPQTRHPQSKTPLLKKVEVSSDSTTGPQLSVISGESQVEVAVDFVCPDEVPMPVVGVVIVSSNGEAVTSASTLHDQVTLVPQEDGLCRVTLVFPDFSLLSGSFWVHAYLLCDKGIHIYDKARMVAELIVSQQSIEQGVVRLPHIWKTDKGDSKSSRIS